MYLEPDVEFVQDGDRSEVIASDSEKYGNMIKDFYQKYGFSFECISENYLERFEKAVSLVDQMLGR